MIGRLLRFNSCNEKTLETDPRYFNVNTWQVLLLLEVAAVGGIVSFAYLHLQGWLVP